jgi:hypothetical protein
MEANVNIDRYTNMLSVLTNGDAGKYRSVMTNYDSLLNRIQHMVSVKSVHMHVAKAHNYYTDKNTIGEKKALIRALNDMSSRNITDKDLADANLKDYRSDATLSLAAIKDRLHELGWSE